MRPFGAALPESILSTQNISLTEITQIALSGWLRTVLLCAFAIVAAATYCHLAKVEYRAQATIVPSTFADKQGAQAITGIAFPRALTSLAGISSDQNESVAKFKTLFMSSELAAKLSENKDIVAALNLGERKAPLLDSINRFLLGVEPNAPSGQAELTQTIGGLLSKVSFVADTKSVSVIVQFDYKNPQAAKEFLAAAIAEADGFLRRQAEERLGEQIEALNKRNSQVQTVAVNQALTGLVISKEADRLSMSQDGYAIIVLSPSAIDRYPSWPKPLILIPIAGLLGAIFGVISTFLAASRRSERRSRHQVQADA